MADLDFYLDPVCPFCWITSVWVREVQSQRDYTVNWRFISLRLLNSHIDYDEHFPPEYAAGHTAGLRLLRLLAAVGEGHGNDAVAATYAEIGARTFEGPEMKPVTEADPRGQRAFAEEVLDAVGLPRTLADALDDDSWDAHLQRETDHALELTGKDVGTPILHVDPPEGSSFFGPVISQVPTGEQAVELWEHVVGLGRFPGFAELKRSLREPPQLTGLGFDPANAGASEDWHAGSRRQKK